MYSRTPANGFPAASATVEFEPPATRKTATSSTTSTTRPPNIGATLGIDLDGSWHDPHVRRWADFDYRQRSRAARKSPSAQTSTLSRSTHSSTAWAPSPPGPNTTVGIPDAWMNAASIQ